VAELFPQDTPPAPADVIREEDTRRGPAQPTTEEADPADWASHPLYRAPDS
jgi:hypothetical protein